MKRIVKGKTYNTATATLVCEKSFYNNGNWFYSKDLYKTKSGIYFFAIQSNEREYFSPKDEIEPVTEKEAQIFCEKYGNPDAYIAEWGEPEGA